MNYFLKRSWIALFGALVFLSSPAAAVQAFVVSPVLVDQTLNPGQMLQGKIHVTSDTDQSQMYTALVQNFVPEGEEGQQTFLPEADMSGLASWITLDRTSFRMDAQASQDVTWTLKIPANAEPGGQYAAVFFSTVPLTMEGATVGVGAKTGVLFLINVTGNIKEAASIESFRTAAYLDRLPAAFELRIRNDGSVHVQPLGTIRITNMLGTVVANVPANPAHGRVLPSSVRRLRSSWGPEDLPEQSGFFAELQSEWNGFALGRYTATAEVQYGMQQQSLTARTSFWVIPWRVLLLIFVSLILSVLLLKGYNQMVIRSAIRKGGRRS